MSLVRERVAAPEFAGFVRRVIRAYARRAADLDPADLAELVALRDELDRAIEAAAGQVKTRFSWAQIGAELGISRQAAQQRWGGAAAALTSAGRSDVNPSLTADRPAATALAS